MVASPEPEKPGEGKDRETILWMLGVMSAALDVVVTVIELDQGDAPTSRLMGALAVVAKVVVEIFRNPRDH